MAEREIKLGQIATARSGDKGDHANLGVVAFRPEGFQYLQQVLSSELIGEFFEGLGVARIERYELPKLWALNFVLYEALGGGASRSLRTDTQGKLLGTAVLELTLPEPENLQEMLTS